MQKRACFVIDPPTGVRCARRIGDAATQFLQRSPSIAGQVWRCSISMCEPAALLPPESTRVTAAQRGHRLSFLNREMPTPSSAWPEAHAAPANWLSDARRRARLKWRAVSFQDAIEGKPEGVSSMIEVN